MEIVQSARKHGVDDADVLHAYENAIRIVEHEYDDEERVLVKVQIAPAVCSSLWPSR